jgi:hypothetical protein
LFKTLNNGVRNFAQRYKQTNGETNERNQKNKDLGCDKKNLGEMK